MAIRLFVERGLALQAVISRPNLRIISPQFRQTRASVSKPSYASIPNYQLLKTFATHRDLTTIIQYIRPFMKDVVLDPDSKNLYFRDPADNLVELSEAATLDVSKNLADQLSGFTDVETKVIGKAVADSLPIIEEITILFEILRRFDDSVSFTDQSSFSYGSNQTETLNISEAPSFDISKPASDSLSVSEASSIQFSRPAADSVSLAESLSRVVTFNRSFTDAFTLDDLAEVDSFVKETGLNKGNVVGMGEDHTYSFQKAVADSFSVSEDLAFSSDKVLSDSATIGESINLTKRSAASSVINEGTFNFAPLNN